MSGPFIAADIFACPSSAFIADADAVFDFLIL